MDVEGHEEKIIKGGIETLQIFKPYILIEIHKWQLGSDALRALLQMLKDVGYSVKYYIQRDLEILSFFGTAKGWDLQSCTIDSLLQQSDNQLPDYFTLFLECRKRKLSRILQQSKIKPYSLTINYTLHRVI